MNSISAQVQVCQRHIEAGEPGSGSWCMLACAIRETFSKHWNMEDIIVSTGFRKEGSLTHTSVVGWFGNKPYLAEIPTAAASIANKWENDSFPGSYKYYFELPGTKVQPFEFYLTFHRKERKHENLPKM